MGDDKSKRGKRDRLTIAKDEGYDVGHFARKHGLSNEQARELIASIGNNRDSWTQRRSASRSTASARPRLLMMVECGEARSRRGVSASSS